MSLLNALGCLSIVPLYSFLCSATIIVSTTEAQECCTSEATLESVFWVGGSRMYGDLHDAFELAM